MSVWRVSLTELLQRKRAELSNLARVGLFLGILIGGSVLATLAVIAPFTYLAVEHPTLCIQLCCAAVLIPCVLWVVRHPRRFLAGLLRFAVVLLLLGLSLAVYLGVIAITLRSFGSFFIGILLSVALLLCVNYLAICFERKGRGPWLSPLTRMLRAEAYMCMLLIVVQVGLAMYVVVMTRMVIAVPIQEVDEWPIPGRLTDSPSGIVDQAEFVVPTNAAPNVPAEVR